MANTCMGLDGSAKADVLEALRNHIRDNRVRYRSRPGGLRYQDGNRACLLWDLYRKESGACSGDACCLAAAGVERSRAARGEVAALAAARRKPGKKRQHKPSRKF
jgi:hypothetical protein